MKYSLPDIIRDAALLAIAVWLMFTLSGWLVESNAMSEDNPKDTVVWIVLGLVSLVCVFAAVFVFEALFLAPFRLWKEAAASTGQHIESLPQALPEVAAIEVLQQPPRTLPPVAPIQLPAYEIENKLRAIDAMRALLTEEMQEAIDEGRALASKWLDARFPDQPAYSTFGGSLSDVHKSLVGMVERIEFFRSKNHHYQDLIQIVQPVWWNSVLPKVGAFCEAYTNVLHLKQEARMEAFNAIMDLPETEMLKALDDLERWRNGAVGQLNEVRQGLTG